jgi:hypothetical protein
MEKHDLLSRLDALRAFLRRERARPADQGPGPKLEEFDFHLATVDDACEALQQ